MHTCSFWRCKPSFLPCTKCINFLPSHSWTDYYILVHTIWEISITILKGYLAEKGKLNKKHLTHLHKQVLIFTL